MSIGPTELLILVLVMLPVLGGVGGILALVYFVTKKPARRPCGACGLPNVAPRHPCPRCGVLVG